jgi:hypothetical protein
MPLADIGSGDLSLILYVIAIGCLLGAAYCAYLRNALACGLLVLVAVIAVIIA